MTTEFNSFDASPLGAFTASRFQDARNQAVGIGGFYLNVQIQAPPEGRYGDPIIVSGETNLRHWDNHVPLFTSAYTAARRPGVNLLVYTDDDYYDGRFANFGIIPAERDLPGGILTTHLPRPFSFAQVFTAIEAAMVGSPDVTIFVFQGHLANGLVIGPTSPSIPQMIRARWEGAVNVSAGLFDFYWLRAFATALGVLGS